MDVYQFPYIFPCISFNSLDLVSPFSVSSFLVLHWNVSTQNKEAEVDSKSIEGQEEEEEVTEEEDTFVHSNNNNTIIRE